VSAAGLICLNVIDGGTFIVAKKEGGGTKLEGRPSRGQRYEEAHGNIR
jgi:hypothetical protein